MNQITSYQLSRIVDICRRVFKKGCQGPQLLLVLLTLMIKISVKKIYVNKERKKSTVNNIQNNRNVKESKRCMVWMDQMGLKSTSTDKYTCNIAVNPYYWYSLLSMDGIFNF